MRTAKAKRPLKPMPKHRDGKPSHENYPPPRPQDYYYGLRYWDGDRWLYHTMSWLKPKGHFDTWLPSPDHAWTSTGQRRMPTGRCAPMVSTRSCVGWFAHGTTTLRRAR